MTQEMPRVAPFGVYVRVPTEQCFPTFQEQMFQLKDGVACSQNTLVCRFCLSQALVTMMGLKR